MRLPLSILILLAAFSIGARAQAPTDEPSAPDTTQSLDPLTPVPDEVVIEELLRDDESGALTEELDAARSSRFMQRADLRIRIRTDDRLRAGFTSGAYPGDRFRTALRLRVTPTAHIDGGIVTEKDPGELALTDHLAGYLRIRDLGPVTSLIAGNFTVSAAQGVVFWKPWAARRRMDAASPLARSSTLLQPFVSTSESGSHRGLAATARAGPFTFLAFHSDTPVDARIDTSNGAITSIDRSGLHRTATERARAANERERVTGARIEWTPLPPSDDAALTRLLVGLSGVLTSYSRPVASGATIATIVYDTLDDRTTVDLTRATWRQSGALGVDAELTHRGVTVFSEAGMMRDARIGGVAGLAARIARTASLSLLYRRYAAGFQSLHGRSAGTGSGSGGNTSGLWLGLRWNVRPALTLHWMHDHAVDLSSVADQPFPETSDMTVVRAEWKISRTVQTVMQMRLHDDGLTLTRTDPLGRRERIAGRRRQLGLRAELNLRASPRAALRLRIEQTRVAADGSSALQHGFLSFAELRIRPLDPVTFVARMSTFATQSYDARLYMYESDVPGMGMSSAIHGSGVRMHVSVSLDLSSRISLWASYGQTIRDGARSVGSGHDLVTGDALGAGTVQMDVRF
jgi:hypothetical protein